MSEFSDPKGKIRFHLGDVLSLLHFTYCVKQPLSVSYVSPHKSPLREDGTCFPLRSDPLSGMIQLAEYLTGEEIILAIPGELDKNSGKIMGRARQSLMRRHPTLIKSLEALSPEVLTAFNARPGAMASYVEQQARNANTEYMDVDKKEKARRPNERKTGQKFFRF